MYTKYFSRIEALRKANCRADDLRPRSLFLCGLVPVWASTWTCKAEIPAEGSWHCTVAKMMLFGALWLLQTEVGRMGLGKELWTQTSKEQRCALWKSLVDLGWMWENVVQWILLESEIKWNVKEGCRMTSWGPTSAGGGEGSWVRDGAYK